MLRRKLFVESFHSLMFASFLGGWEMVLIAAILLILLGAKNLPEMMRGMRTGQPSGHYGNFGANFSDGSDG